jgi:hypothetical protein
MANSIVSTPLTNLGAAGNPGTLEVVPLPGFPWTRFYGPVTNEPHAIMRLESDTLYIHTNDLINRGLFEMTGSAHAQIRLHDTATSTAGLINEATGTFDVLAGGSRAIDVSVDNRGTFDVYTDLPLNHTSHVNSGTITVDGGDLDVWNILTFNNSGTIQAIAGNISFRGSDHGAGSFVNSGTIDAVNGVPLDNFATIYVVGTMGTDVVVTGNFTRHSAVYPGLSPGILNVVGDYSQNDKSSLHIEIGGDSPGDGAGFHDQINVTGTVSLGNAALSVTSFGGYVPAGGESYVIVNNDGTDAVSSAFAGRPEGYTYTNFLGSGLDATLSYIGGTGNDVVIAVEATGTTEVTTVGNTLTVTDVDGGDSNDNLSISFNDTTDIYTITDTGGLLIDASSGTIDITGNAQISYTGLEPISSTITATNVTLNYSTTAETITVTDAGSGQTTVDSNVAAESVTFNNPTGTLQINAGDTGGDTVNVEGFGTGFAASVAIDGQGGTDTVNFQTNATDTGGGSLTVTADEITTNVLVTTVGGDLSLSATGDVTLNGLVTTGGGAFNVSADSDGDGTGTFTLNANAMDAWTEEAKLTAGDAKAWDGFGISVAISGEIAIVGATGEDAGGSSAGAVYVFTRSGTAWTQEEKLIADDAEAGDFFGYSVAISGESGVVGATGEAAGGPNAGAAYAFDRLTGVATSTGAATITAADVVLNDNLAGSGALIVKPSTADSGIGIGGGTGDFNIDDTELGKLADGFSSITIGDATSGSGQVDIDSSTFADPVTILGGSVAVTGLDAGSNSVTLTARTGAITDGGDSATDVTGGAVTLQTLDGTTGDIGAAGDAISLAAASLTTDSSASGDNQYLAETDSVTATSINAGTGTLELTGGELDLATNSVNDNTNLTVGSHTVTLNDQNTAVLGPSTTIAGGTLTSSTVISLSSTDSLSGYGTASARISGGSSTQITASGGDLTLGDETQATGFSFDGTLTVGSNTLTLKDSDGAELGTSTAVASGGTLISSSGVSLGSGDTLAMDGTVQADVAVGNGAMLRGSGTVAGAVAVADGGTFAPGTSPGITTTNALSMATGSILDIEIDGTAGAGATGGHDQVHVTTTGTTNVNLDSDTGGGATLNVALGYTPNAGDSFKIIDNDGTDAIQNTFASPADSGTFTVGSTIFHITYAGGSNSNDVVLTANTAPTLDNTLSPTLTAIAEDNTTSAGETVASIVVDGSITDPDGAVEAIAITAADDTNGTWQYKIGVGSWTAIDDGSLAANHALLLDSSDFIRFVPNADWYGTATFTFRAWDKSADSAGTYADTTTSGGNTPYSTTTDTAQIEVTPMLEGPATVSIVANDASAAEAGSDGGQLTVSLSGGEVAPAGGVTVTFSVGGNAAPGTDYTALGTSATIPQGSNSATIDVTGVVDDRLVEGDEDIDVTLTGTDHVDVTVGSPNSATVIITDNDTATVTLSGTADVVEGGATDTLTATLTLSTSGTGTESLQTAITGVTLASHGDYSSDTQSFGVGAMDNDTVTLTVTATDDRYVEGPESFSASLAATTSNASVSEAGSGRVNVTDNDSVSFSIQPTNTVTEQDGAQTINVTMTITAFGSGDTELGAGIILSMEVVDTMDASATAATGTDYDIFGIQSVSFTSADGAASSKTVTITPKDDKRVEGGVTVKLKLQNLNDGLGGHAGLGVVDSTVTITDNDTADITFAAGTGNFIEDNTSAAVTVTLVITPFGTVGDPGLDRTVSIQVNDKNSGAAGKATTAGTNADYSYTNTTITFSPADGSSFNDTVTVTYFEDILIEGDETIRLDLEGLNDGTNGQVSIDTPSTHTVTINDDDTGTQARYDATAGGNYRIVRSGGNLQIYLGATLLTEAPLAASNSLLFNGSTSNDSLSVDFSGGNPVPTSGITFHGNDPSSGSGDSLTVTGGSGFTSLTYDMTGAGAGRLTIDGSSVINFTGLEPITVVPAATTVTVNIDPLDTNPGVATEFTSAGAGITRVSATGVAYEEITFANPIGQLIVNGDPTHADTIKFTSLGSGFNAALAVDGQGGADSITLDTALALGSATSTGDVSVTAETINLNADVTTDGGANGGSVGLDGAVTTSAAVTIDTDAGGTDGDVSLGGSLALGENFNVRAGGGDVTFTGAATIGTNNFTVESSANTAVTGGIGGATGNVDINASTRTDVDAPITLSGAGSINVERVVLSSVNVNTVGSVITFEGPASTDNGTVLVSTGASAGGNVQFQSTLMLGSDLTVTAGAGNVTFTGTVDDDGGTGTSSDLLVSSSGTTRFNSAIGTTNRLDGLTVVSADTVQFDVADIDVGTVGSPDISITANTLTLEDGADSTNRTVTITPTAAAAGTIGAGTGDNFFPSGHLQYASLTTLNLNMGTGTDDVTVDVPTVVTTTTMNLTGDDPSGDPGDNLTVQPGGRAVTDDGSTITVATNAPINYSEFETVVLLASTAQGVSIDFVKVANPGNTADGTGYGAVDYEYYIGKYEITAGQYTEFLNAVAARDPHGLYSSSMWSGTYGCKIQRSGVRGGYTYSVAPDWADRPVNYVSFWSAARFANWLHNGQPTGAQGPGTTEDGAYRNIGDQDTFARQDGEWPYPSIPGIGSDYCRTEVGEWENSDSPYGTFDQGGNVWEWNEAIVTGETGSYRCLRGGSFYYCGVDHLHASPPFRNGHFPGGALPGNGFRVASDRPRRLWRCRRHSRFDHRRPRHTEHRLAGDDFGRGGRRLREPRSSLDHRLHPDRRPSRRRQLLRSARQSRRHDRRCGPGWRRQRRFDDPRHRRSGHTDDRRLADDRRRRDGDLHGRARFHGRVHAGRKRHAQRRALGHARHRRLRRRSHRAGVAGRHVELHDARWRDGHVDSDGYRLGRHPDERRLLGRGLR